MNGDMIIKYYTWYMTSDNYFIKKNIILIKKYL